MTQYSLFALNIKQELLNEEAESTAIFQMISLKKQIHYLRILVKTN